MAAQVEVTHKRDQSKRRERLFYTGMAVAFVLTVFAGFARTFYLRPHFQTQSLIPLLVLHGIVFTSWIALLLTQTTLVATKRTRTHMRLGVAGGLLASLMILIGTVTAIVRAKGPSPVPGVNPLSFLTIPLGDMLVFAILVWRGVLFSQSSGHAQAPDAARDDRDSARCCCTPALRFHPAVRAARVLWPQRSFYCPMLDL